MEDKGLEMNELSSSVILDDEDILDDDEDPNVILDEVEDKNELDAQNRYSWMYKPRAGWYPETRDYDGDIECVEEIQGGDPYDNFMRRHLQHYGYFTGRNASYRNNYDGLENWHRNYDLRLSGMQNLSVDDEQLRKRGHLSAHKNAAVDPNLGQFFGEGQPADDLLTRTTQLVFHYQAGKKIPKLREPRNLYALTKEAGPQQATRWPSHMQVVCSSVHFIEYIPPVPDPFYIPTGKESTPAVRGTPNGEIIYLNDPGRDVYFMRSRVAGCRLAMRDISLTPRESIDEGNFTLEFESRFESGNLLKVVKINNYDYELTLRPDLYTDRHTQWFFFRVKNMVPGETYRFTIVNLMKPSSLYNNGMKPLFYSDMNAKKSKIGWTRAGNDIRYYRNNLGTMSGRTYYSLTWTIQFPHKGDTCYFAHCYPYTYTDLQEYLLKLANDPVRSRFCKQRVLCRTLAGNLVYILTITSPSRNPEIARMKKAVVITARVHPGETNSSWMMKGFLDFLSGNSADAKLLRNNFIFKIVPMLNPDGVIVGNYRCSLAGRDLNRNYKSVLKDSFPSVWHVKMMVKRLNMEREVILYCDLHGHSRKSNIFIYGCENKNNPKRKFRERIFPLMLSKNANTKFQYESCKFKIQKSKEGTGRVVMWCMGVMNSYTMEATFGGTTLGSRKGTHFSTRDLEEMGHNFCDTLLDYCDPDTSKVDACYQEIQDRVKKQILKRMQMRNMQGNLGDVNLDDYSSEYESDTSGSDSSCDDRLPVHLLAIAPKLQRKRRLKSRRDRNKQMSRKSSAPNIQEDAKPTPSHGAKTIADKPKPIRYSQTAGSKRKEDHAHVSVGTTSHLSGFSEERATKKLNKVTVKYFEPMVGILTIQNLERPHTTSRSDYLEALTTAYIRSGVLMVPDKKEYSMRYTNGLGKKQDSNLTVQYLANQLTDLTADSGSENDIPLMRNASCQWSPQPDTYNYFDSDNKSYNEETKDAVLAEEQYEILRRSAIRRQLSPAQQRVLAQRHLVAVAQMQQRREQVRTVPATSDLKRGGTPIKQHPNPFDEKGENPGTSRTNSRCASASLKQEARKIPVQSTSRPGTRKPPLRASPERTTSFSNKISESAIDQSFSTNKTSNAVPCSTKISVADEELIIQEQQKQTVNISSPSTILTNTIKHALQSNEPFAHDNSSDFFISKTMHSSSEYKKKTVNSFESDFEKPKLEDKSKSQSILLFATADKFAVDKNINLSDMKEDAKEFLPFEDLNESTSSPHKKRKESNVNATNQNKTSKHNPVFGESLVPMDDPHARKISPIHQQRSKMKSSNQSPVLSENAFGANELSLDKLPKQWGGKKQLVTLAVSSESSPEPIKRERPRVLSAKRNALTNVIAEGHGSRYRAKNYQGNNETESYFGMSDNVGPVTLKHGVRVPPVVANIAELRRSLMGQGREGKDDETSIKASSVSPPKHKQHDLNAEEPRTNEERTRKINLRPRANLMYRSTLFEEKNETAEQYNNTEPGSNSDKYASKAGTSIKPLTSNEYSREKYGRRHSPTTLRNADYANNSVVAHSSSDIEELVEEKWPTPNESEIRRYSQGNATIEKLGNHSLTSIRFGSRNEHGRRLREQWIDVHQRQVITGVPRQDIVAMNSLSLNMDGGSDEKPFVTTPALAKRPVPPLLRYLSAKQQTTKKKL
uniref:uncharacterized protein LOC120342204 isoform X2 n=1 Tax=Styela clava TaxID=7725 RepID=UPI00193951DE|nr:uncharacterized protein LOC120342204 isoform X2 [Styela clava]